MNVVECSELTKLHGSTKALDDLTLTIKENTITGLIGRNGAGKTTLLKILAGYWKETTGDISVFSKRPFNNLHVSANAILIDDQMQFPESLTLLEILKQGEHFFEKWDMDLAKRLFNYFSFDERQFHKNLSKGKKSTFNVVFGLATRCALTMFDEPTTGMDAAVRKDFYRALLKDYLSFPRTLMISSHHLEEIEDILEDVLLIEKGRKHLHLPIDELRGYAVGLSGKTAIVEQWIYDKEVLFRNQIGEDHSYVVVKNDMTVDSAKQMGIEVSFITLSDLCVYLTNQTKGGIDDVFNKR